MAGAEARQPRAGAGPDRPKVVYLMGTARSGSTILGVALGNCANTFYAGELGGWLKKSGVSWLDGSERARFWSDVRDQVADADDLFGEEALQTIELTTALFRVHRWRTRRRLLPRYRQVAEDLYRAIAGTSGATHVIDSSSHPLRARELKKLSAIDLYLVYLVRDPRSVVDAFTSPGLDRFSRSTLFTNAYLWLTSLLATVVFLTHRRDRRVFLRYEDFTRSPEPVLRQLLGVLELESELPDLSALRTGIPFQGNRLLRSGEVVAFRRQSVQPARSSRLTEVLQSPWALLQRGLRPRAVASRPPRRERSREHAPTV
jgi:hypothetical protein